jgi:hypothetical protein
MIVRAFWAFSFSRYSHGDLHALLATLIPLPEGCGKVRYRYATYSPLPLLLDGLRLLGEVWLAQSS